MSEVTVACTGEAIGIALGSAKAAIEPVIAIATIQPKFDAGFHAASSFVPSSEPLNRRLECGLIMHTCSLSSNWRMNVGCFTRPPMHLKSYQIDGRLLRTGAANFP